MKDTTFETKPEAGADRALELLSLQTKLYSLTIRDDQYDFPWLLDLVKAWRRQNRRFRLIDSGKLDVFSLEWLGEAGADIYTSEKVRKEAEELELILKACRRGKAITACVIEGPLTGGEETAGSFSGLVSLALGGVYFYVSSRKVKHEFPCLLDLASACRRGGSWLTYYHHGPLEPALEELARSGAWIHLSDQSFEESEGIEVLLEAAKAGLEANAGVVVHTQRKWGVTQLEDILRAGAFVLFRSSLSDYKSPLRPLEEEAGRRKLDFRAYYLYPNFFL